MTVELRNLTAQTIYTMNIDPGYEFFAGFLTPRRRDAEKHRRQSLRSEIWSWDVVVVVGSQ